MEEYPHKHKKYVFAIIGCNRTYVIAANSESEMNSWMKVLNKCIDKLSNTLENVNLIDFKRESVEQKSFEDILPSPRDQKSEEYEKKYNTLSKKIKKEISNVNIPLDVDKAELSPLTQQLLAFYENVSQIISQTPSNAIVQSKEKVKEPQFSFIASSPAAFTEGGGSTHGSTHSSRAARRLSKSQRIPSREPEDRDLIKPIRS